MEGTRLKFANDIYIFFLSYFEHNSRRILHFINTSSHKIIIHIPIDLLTFLIDKIINPNLQYRLNFFFQKTWSIHRSKLLKSKDTSFYEYFVL